MTNDEIFTEGLTGLHKAVETFDHRKGYRLSTYATYWIRQSINRYLENFVRPIRVPAHIHQQLARIKRERSRLTAHNGTEPATDELAASVGIEDQRLQYLDDLRQLYSSTASLNTPMTAQGTPKGNGNQTLEETLPEKGSSTDELLPVLFDTTANEARTLKNKLRKLKKIDAYIIKERYGIGQT